MKFSILFLGFVLSTGAFARCEEEAKNIASAAMNLFKVNDVNHHCLAVGGMISFESLPVIMVMPNRYAYEARFKYPCGPHPKKPVVTMLLNEYCKIVNLEISGFKLEP